MKALPLQVKDRRIDQVRQLAMTGTDSIYQEITDRIIKRIEAGTIPWQEPWTAVPKNIVSKKAYRGVNVLILATTEFS
jgi:antirestriction protein ArdC